MRFTIFFVCVGLWAQNTNVAPDTVVLKVHDKQYTRAEFEEILKLQKADPKQVAARLAENNSVGRAFELAGEARRRGLDKDPTLQAKLATYEAGLLNQALLQSIVAEVHKDESLSRQRYASHQHIAEERQIRQILIRHTKSKPIAGKLTPEQALAKIEDLRKKLAAGADFASLAKLHSDDETSRNEGGDMKLQRKPSLVPEFGALAFKLKKGELSEVVKTSYGYHLMRVEQIVPPTFEAVRKSIEFDLANERFVAMGAKGVVMNPDYFGK